MPRIPRVWGIPALGRAAARSQTPTRVPFVIARAKSTAGTGKIRGMLWKDGEAPGAEDPYTQRPETEGEKAGLPEEARGRAARDKRPRAVRETKLAMPRRRTEATTEQEVASSDPNYTPAASLDDLAEVGDLKTWWDQPGHWGAESSFQGFGRADKLLDKELVEVHLRRAVVEVLALRDAGKLSEWAMRKWAEGSGEALRAALKTPVTVAEEGRSPSLGGDASAIVAQLTSVEEGEADTPAEVSLDEARELVKSWDSSWKEIVLDTEAKFAIRKRLYQLTGSLIPDAKLGAAQTVRHVLTVASRQPKPKKLAEQLAAQGEQLSSLPNLRIHDKKIGPIDRETELGRWKVVEGELEKRGLPITGTDGLPSHKERRWLRGDE